MRRRLLIVDDDKRYLGMIKTLLVGGDPPFLRDCDVFTDSRPFSHADQYGSFDAVILDYALGTSESGVYVAQQIRDRWPDKPLMLLSGVVHALTEADRAPFVAVADKMDLEAIWNGARELMRQCAEMDAPKKSDQTE